MNSKPSEKPIILAACFMLISCLAYSSALKLEATGSSKILVGFQWTTQRYMPEDRTVHLPFWSSSSIAGVRE
jgi:hypothetical protein